MAHYSKSITLVMSRIYHRPKLALDIAKQLLRPSFLDQGLRSGLFLSGPRRTGKSTFLRQDLIPAMENAGALVVYVDLWSDVSADPKTLIHVALRSALEGLHPSSDHLPSGLQRRSSEKGGIPIGATIAQIATGIVDQAKTDLVFIVDEVQHMLASDSGLALLQALKAARDAVNARPSTCGYFIFIGAGSHPAQVAGMVTHDKNAFTGATALDHPSLGEDYVQFVLQTMQLADLKVIPSLPVASQSFALLGRRPEDLLRALRVLQQYGPQDADRYLPVIAATLQETASDLEINKIRELGTLACSVLDRVARA